MGGFFFTFCNSPLITTPWNIMALGGKGAIAAKRRKRRERQRDEQKLAMGVSECER